MCLVAKTAFIHQVLHVNITNVATNSLGTLRHIVCHYCLLQYTLLPKDVQCFYIVIDNICWEMYFS